MAPLIWLITGCSSGLGEQFIRSILARGDKAIATARKIDTLKGLEEAGAAILQLDVTDSTQEVKNAVTEAMSFYGRIDVLVNNAGYVQIGNWEDLEIDQLRTQFDTNVFGTVKMTQAILPHFRSRRSGTLVFISSLSGWIGHPSCSAYAGSKFALEGMVEALRDETKDLGIKTLLIEPGRFRTRLLSTGNIRTINSDIPDYSNASNAVLKGLAQEDQNQPGDPLKLVKTVIDLVKEEGVAQGKEIPFRLPLGVDCYDDLKAKCENTLDLLKNWEGVIKSTDIDE